MRSTLIVEVNLNKKRVTENHRACYISAVEMYT